MAGWAEAHKVDQSKRAIFVASAARLAAAAFLIMGVALALGGCASQAQPAPPSSGYPINEGHTVWCGTNPPSGISLY